VSGWVIGLGYGAVWLLYGWRLTIYLLDAQLRDSLTLSIYRGPGGVARAKAGWLPLYLLAGFGLAAVWPVVAPVRGIYRRVSDAGLFTTPVEREYAERQELDELRKLAREHGLPMPGNDIRKGAA
jgi:hypothetical protein